MANTLIDWLVSIGGRAKIRLSNDAGLAEDSDEVVATQKAVKAYVDGSTGIAGITASAAEINKLTGATVSTAEINKLTGAGAVVASGTQAEHVADAKTDYAKTDLDDDGTIDGTEIAAALNATNAKINAILASLEAFGINADA